MSDHASHAYHKGDMNIEEQAATFHAIMGLAKWCSLALAVFLVLAVGWFCTPMGFFPAAVLSLIVLGLGVVFLRDKGEGAH